ncbi:MAG: PadR family transcriptional regulator [Acidobacteriota bacterium]
MDVQSILLGFLGRKSMTGYELKRAFSISFSYFSGLSFGSIYPALSKLESGGLVTMSLERRSAGLNRKVYSITEKGRRAFLDHMRAPLGVEPFRSSFLMRLFFFADLRPEERRDSAGEYLDSIREIHSRLKEAHPEIRGRADRFQYLCFRFGLRFFEDLERNVTEIIEAMGEESGHG